MKKGIYAILAALAVFALVMTGCDTGGGDPPKPSTTIKITYNLNVPAAYDGTAPTPVDQVSINKNTEIGAANLNAPEGFTEAKIVFDGWFTKAGDDGEKVEATSKFDKDTTLYGHWTLISADDVVITFNLNYDTGDAEQTFRVVFSKNADGDVVGGDKWPADPTRAGTTTGKDGPNDTWAFKSWKQYDLGTGDTYTKTTKLPGSTINNTVWAYWEPSSGPAAETPPANTDVARAEQVTLADGAYVVYKITLPVGKSWTDYTGDLKVSYMVGNIPWEGIGGVQVNAARIMGNYTTADFELVTGDAAGSAPGKKLAIAPYNDKNGPYILDNTYGANAYRWKTVKEFTTNATVNAAPWQWFELSYKVNGTTGGGDLTDGHKPNATPNGPYYFGVGLAGNGTAGGGLTQYIRDVTLIGTNEDDNVTGTPVWFTDGIDVYPAFAGWRVTGGGSGFKENSRNMVTGTNPAPEATVLAPAGALVVGNTTTPFSFINANNNAQRGWEAADAADAKKFAAAEYLVIVMTTLPGGGGTIISGSDTNGWVDGQKIFADADGAGQNGATINTTFKTARIKLSTALVTDTAPDAYTNFAATQDAAKLVLQYYGPNSARPDDLGVVLAYLK